MVKFCVYCGAALQPVAGSGRVITCSSCGKAFHDPMAAQAARVAPPAQSGLPAVAWVIILLAAVPVVVAVLGILAAIAIPNFIRFQARSKQAECRATLKRIVTAQQAYREANGAFATTFEALSVSAPPDNRYAYMLGAAQGQRLEPAPKWGTPRLAGANLERASASGEGYTALCVGNIDNDEAVDVWGVSSEPQVDASGTPVAAGTLFELVNDVTTSE
jgi:type IV pilus assembly protein PilA